MKWRSHEKLEEWVSIVRGVVIVGGRKVTVSTTTKKGYY